MTVVADLEFVKAMIGARTVTDDAIIDADLQTATSWVYDRVALANRDADEVQTAIALITARLYKRRQSPDGLAGWSADGVVARIAATDPDVKALLARKRDYSTVGLG